MKFLFSVLFLFILGSASGQNLVGYLKNSGSFTNTAALSITPCNVAAYISGRNFGQIGIGDVITNSSGTPLNGGSTWWGFSKVNGGTSLYRGYKIDGSGVVISIVVPSSSSPNAMTAVAFHNNSGASSCAGTGFTFPIYGAQDDPGIYSNKPVYSSPGGGTFTNGTLFTSSPMNGGTAFTTFTYSSTDSKATSVACCAPNAPFSYAGPDGTYTTADAQIPLNGVGIDCDGTTTFSWSRISGPNTPTINDATAAMTYITGFTTGTYVYRITVTDNGGHSTTDDVTYTVYPPPLVSNPVLLPTAPSEVIGLEGEDFRGVVGSSWNYFDVGNVDPLQSQYDYNTTQAGWQIKTSSGRIARFNHDWLRAGMGRGVLRKKDTVEYITEIGIYDTTQSAGQHVKFYIGDSAKIRKARWWWEYGLGSAPAPDYDYTTTATKQYTFLPTTGQDSGYLVYAVFDNGLTDVTIFLYGGKSPFNTLNPTQRRDEITYSDDGTLNARKMHGVNNDGALPGVNVNYPRDSLPFYSALRLYAAPVCLVCPATKLSQLNGMMDPDSVAFDPITGPYSATNLIDLNPYINGVGSNPFVDDSIIHRRDHFTLLQNLRGVNGLYASQSGYDPESAPKNTAASNTRSRLAWTRKGYEIESVLAKFGSVTNPPHPEKYRYRDNNWGNQFGLNFISDTIELGNENDEGFRGTNAYMTPEEDMFARSTWYDSIKAMSPNTMVLTQAYVAGNNSALKAAIANAQLYYNGRRKWFDGVSWHTTINYELYDHTPTSTDLCGQHGALPGLHNERKRMKDLILDVDRDLGFHVPWFITEYSYTKDSIGPTDCSTFSDGFYSLIGAPQIETHTKFENHAIAYAQSWIHYFGLAKFGVRGLWWYTLKDNVDTAGNQFANYKAADGSNGLTNYINNPRIIFPAYYYTQSIVNRYATWHWLEEIRNDSIGLFIDLWQEDTHPDSLTLVVMNQNRNALINVGIDIGNSGPVTKYSPSFNSFTMSQTSQSTTNGLMNVNVRPEIDFYTFTSSTPFLIRFRKYNGLKFK
jgi:hypothetical protein